MPTMDDDLKTLADSAAVTTHLQILQGIITRLANNSASAKGWCLTLVTALLGFAATAHQPLLIWASAVPIFAFGFVNLMYLAQETAYRRLYNETVERIRAKQYDASDLYRAGVAQTSADRAKAFGSWSILPVYGGLVLIYALAWAGGLFAIVVDP